MINIKYEIFRNRKKFNIIKWLESDKEKTFNSFVEFLSSKNVLPPLEDYFNKALEFYNDKVKKSEEKAEEANEVVEEVKKETIPIEVTLPNVSDSESSHQEEKPKSTRRRRKSKKDED